jgi:capsular exopolysaccharide synthesis family protein
MQNSVAKAGTTTTAITGTIEPATSYVERQPELAAFWRRLMRRRAMMIQIFVGFVALMLIGTLLWPKSYTTTIKVIAGDSNGASNLHTGPEMLLKHVAVIPITNTNILSISVTWSDPKTSAAIANAFGQAIVDRQRQLVASQATAALASLKQQLPQAGARMDQAQNKLASFEASHRIANIDEQTQSTITGLANLDAKIGQTQADRQQATAQLASANKQLGSVPPTITGSSTISQNPVVAQLQTQLTQVNIQLQQDEQQYTDQYPAVIALKAQQKQLEDTIARDRQTVVSGLDKIPNPLYQQLQQQAATSRSQIAADSAQVAELDRQRRSMEPLLAALPAQTAELANLQRDATAAQDVDTALQQKYVNAQVASETAISDVTITQPASAGDAQVRPDVILNFIISLFLGAVLAVMGALVMDYFDNSIQDEGQVEEELAIPQLASIPLVELRNGEAIVPWVKSLALESFLQLVTNMKYSTDQPLRSIAIVSPTQGDGKSTTALNVALALNEIEGPVLLVDADLRRPSLHAKLGLRNERGLSDVLVGRSTPEAAIQIHERSGLAVMTSGTAAPNPIKLLESPRFDAMLADLQERYQTVVFDAAALSGVLDSGVLARRVNGTVLVVSHGTTDLRETNAAMKRLARMGVRNVLGFVLNRVQPRRADYSPYASDVPELYTDDAPIVVARQ